MVKDGNYGITGSRDGKGLSESLDEARIIKASTEYETCGEHLSPFGGLLAMEKFFDLTGFREIFIHGYNAPAREPKLGHHLMVKGILMLLFVGFNRIWHFAYIQLDAMFCGILGLKRLPVVSTFWRYLDSLGINQANSLLNIMSVLRERVWKLCGFEYRRIRINIDTTVETVFGNQQGARKGHNTKNRGKKGYRPILCFIEQTREYLLGKLRKGDTISGKECASFISRIQCHLPGCVQEVLMCADGEFLSWDSVSAAEKEGFDFIIANKGCNPPFPSSGWYRPRKRSEAEYNSCYYRPIGWGASCRFVVMRIPKKNRAVKPGQMEQCPLFEDDECTYRIFCTNLSGKAHEIIDKYDKRADVENLIGEAKREGLDAIPSFKFKTNYAFFQIVMLAYNIWRYLKLLAEHSIPEDGIKGGMCGIANNTIRIARLRILLIAAKVVFHSNKTKVKYSVEDSRTPTLLNFLTFLDEKRSEKRPWLKGNGWPCRFSFN